jgi:hypothetical protein
MKRALFSIMGISLGILAWTITTACNQQTIQTPVRSFDGPKDVALTCVKYRQDNHLYDVHPVNECNPNTVGLQIDMGTQVSTPFLGPNPEVQFLMALVTQASRGEVALVDTAQDKLVSLQPKLPGFGFLPVGLNPEHIRTTRDGCIAVTSNTDSCDYGVIDVSTMINGALPPTDMGRPAVAPSVADNVVRRIVAAVPDGNGGARVLPARPSWIEIAPDSTDALHGYEAMGTPGQCTVKKDNNGQVITTKKAWVALPNCELLVKLNLDPPATPEADPTHPTHPTVEQAIKITRDGAQVVTDLTTLSCPAECSGLTASAGDGGVSDMAQPPRVDAASGDMSAPPLFNATQAFPGTIAVDVEGGRLIIGDLYGERIDIIPVDASGNLGTPRKVQLEPPSASTSGGPGVRVVRVSPRSYAGKFLYAIARDGSVRVIDLDREVECETNPDPRFNNGNGINLQDPAPPADPLGQARVLGCFPLGDPNTPPRAWYATTPGIQLATGQLPKDIAFVHVEVPPGPVTTNVAPPAAAPGLLVGDFAWIVSSDGRGTIVDIYDSCPQPNQQDETLTTAGPYPFGMCDLRNVERSRAQTVQHFGHPTPLLLDRLAHRLRGGHLRFQSPATPDDTTGMARIADEFNPFNVVVPSTSQVADAGVPNTDAGASPNLPGLYQEMLPPSLTQTVDTAPTRVIKFVDPDRVLNELWSLAWEGLIPGTSRELGHPLVGGYFSDSGGAWCSHGVRKGDKLVYTGCSQDADCDYTQQCVHDPGAPPDVLNGLCLPTNISDPTHHPNDTIDTWSRSDRCGLLLRAQRKYRITSAKVQQPLPMGSQTGQKTDFLKLAEIYEPEYLTQTHECMNDSNCSDVTIPPAGGVQGNLATRCLVDYDGKSRCLLGCDPAKGDDSRCGADFECTKSTQGDQRCMRAPLNDTTFGLCFPELQDYEIRAGEAFVVAGVTSGFAVNEIPDATGECTVPDQSNEYVRLRQARVPLEPADTCALASPLDSMSSIVSPTMPMIKSNVCLVPTPAGQLTQSQIIHFENGTFNIAVTVPKDSNGVVIVPPDGTSVGFNIIGGGGQLTTPLGLDVQAEDPSYVLVGPDNQTVYIVDSGKQPTATGLRGQLLRLFTPTQSIDRLFRIR